KRPAFRAAVVHGALDREPAGHRIVAVDDFAGDAERLAAVDDVRFTVLAGRRGRNSPAIIHDDDQDRQLLTGPGAPDQARGEIALGRARVATGYDADPLAAVPLLHQRSAGGHHILDFDHG